LSDIQIRSAVATDLPNLMRFDHASASDYVWQLDLRKENGQVLAGFREVRLPRPISVSYPRNPLALADEWTQRSATFVALAGNIPVPVGYACILEHSQATTAWVTDLVVEKGSRRQGIGSALLNAAQDWASGRSDRDIFLEMTSKNYPAIRLAHKFGFEFCGYNDHYYITQDVALFFGRSLM
jgi:ribosomal protein S18 acetylase RimI-like enzyme